MFGTAQGDMMLKGQARLCIFVFAVAVFTQASEGNPGADMVSCLIRPGFIDPLPVVIRLTLASDRGMLWGTNNDRGKPISKASAERYLDTAADSDPQPVVEIRSDNPDAAVADLMPLIGLVRGHHIVYIWIDTFHTIHAPDGSNSSPVGIFCTQAQLPSDDQPIALRLSATGRVYWDGEPITTDGLRHRLKKAAEERRNRVVRIAMDRAVTVRALTDVLFEIQRSQIEGAQFRIE